MDCNQLSQNYVKKYAAFDSERKRIRGRIEQRNAQIARLEKKLNRLFCPSWVDELLEPIAKAMVATMPNRYYDILGPFGMTSETSIHFYKNGVDREHLFDDCRSITFRPTDLDKGKLSLVDHTRNTHRYAEGTMGEVNGMNYPTLPMKESIDELLDFMTQQEKKTKVVA